jgi:flagellar motor switch protein FliN/FliY
MHMKTDLKSILALEVPLAVVLGERQINVNDVVNWVPGSIFELPKSAEDDLEIWVNDRAVGLGSAVKIGENFGIRVTYVGDLKQRLLALKQEQATMPVEEEESDGMSAEDIAMALLDGQL